MFFSSFSAFAQGEKQLIFFSGFVVQGEDSKGIEGIYVINKSANRGAISDQLGYFSLGVRKGDTVLIKSFTHKETKIIIPEVKKEYYSIIVNLKEKEFTEPVIDIFPLPTEEIFKQALMAMSVEKTKTDHLREAMNKNLMAALSFKMKVSPEAAYNQIRLQQFNTMHSGLSMTTIPLLNPFNWAKFIKSVKNGDFKKGSYKDKKQGKKTE